MNDISLKLLTSDDLELVRNWRNSPEVSSYMYTESHITEDQQIAWFDNITQLENCKYWIIEFDNRKVGLVFITDISSILSSCYWAFYLGDTSIRGAGIGAKVEYNILEYVFNQLNLNKLRCEVFVTNDKVIKMHEKFGFRREAYYREHCIKNNQKLDVVGLALLKSDWSIISLAMRNKIYGE